MNYCNFSGYATCDPKMTRRKTGGKEYVFAEFGIAVGRDYRKNGKPTADFPWFTCYDKQALLAEKYLRKGRKVVVEAQFRNEAYKDKNGKTQYKTWFDVHRLELCDIRNVDNNDSDTGTFVASNVDVSGFEGADFYSENPNT